MDDRFFLPKFLILSPAYSDGGGYKCMDQVYVEYLFLRSDDRDHTFYTVNKKGAVEFSF